MFIDASIKNLPMSDTSRSPPLVVCSLARWCQEDVTDGKMILGSEISSDLKHECWSAILNGGPNVWASMTHTSTAAFCSS